MSTLTIATTKAPAAVCTEPADHTVDVNPHSKCGYSCWTCAARHEAPLDEAHATEDLRAAISTCDDQVAQEPCGWPLAG